MKDRLNPIDILTFHNLVFYQLVDSVSLSSCFISSSLSYLATLPSFFPIIVLSRTSSLTFDCFTIFSSKRIRPYIYVFQTFHPLTSEVDFRKTERYLVRMVFRLPRCSIAPNSTLMSVVEKPGNPIYHGASPSRFRQEMYYSSLSASGDR